MRLIIDGTQLFVRCQRAYGLSGLSDSQGRPTGVAWGYLRSLRAYKKRWPDAAVHVCWDGTSERRKAMFDGYKINREPRNHDINFEHNWLREILPFLDVAQHENEHEEADDVMASIVRRHPTEFRVIATTDRDMLQLVSHSVQLWCPPVGDNAPKLYDMPAVLAEYGVLPENVLDVRALCGDPSDDVPGVPGIGIKTASKAVQKHGAVHELLASDLSALTTRQAKLILDNADLVRRNLNVLRLYTVPYDIRDATPDIERAAELMRDLDMRPELLIDGEARQLPLF